MEIEGFLSLIKGWAERQEDVKGVLLVGSYARGAAREDSDVDIVILTIKPELYLDSISFAENFGSISKWEKEYWGSITSIRVWYQEGLEIEFGITLPDWASQPLDPGTLRVISDGMQIVFDREGSFHRACSTIGKIRGMVLGTAGA
jgi:predicted nucleotidyltransferase